MKCLKFCFVCIGVIFVLAGCKRINKYTEFGKYDDYKKSQSHDCRLVVPKGMNKKAIKDHYPVPKVNKKCAIHSSVIPPGR